MEKRLDDISNLLCRCALVAVVILLMRWVLPPILPFLAAFAVAAMLRPVVRFLTQKAHWPRPIACFAVLLVLFTLLCGAGGCLAIWLTGRLGNLLAWVSDLWQKKAAELLQTAAARLELLLHLSENALEEPLAGLVSAVQEKLLQLAEKLAGSLPGLIFRIAVFGIATVFFVLDDEKITAFLLRVIPKSILEALRRQYAKASQITRRFVRVYSLLFLLTFFLLLVGFLLLRIKQAFVLAAVIAMLDILPVLGTGTVLLPWSVLCFCRAQDGLGVGLLVLYGIIWVVRQLCEAKLVGAQLGLHPLVSLMLLYLGVRLFGAVGVLLPYVVILLGPMPSATNHIDKNKQS